MKGRHALTAGILVLTVLGAACTAGGSQNQLPPTVNPSASHSPVTLSLWSFFTGDELSEFNTAIASFHQQYPWITVKSVPGKDDTAVLNAIHAGTAPDVGVIGVPDDSAEFCSTSAYMDLNPFIKQDKIDIARTVPAGALAYTSYKGDQCMLPMLTDAYGLYYNTDLFAKAGIATPPKTYSEFFTDVKQLTQFNPDGSIKVAGFFPLTAGDYELANFENGVYSGAQWYDSSGKSSLASDPRFATMLQFVKSMADWFGYDKLNRFFAQVGGEDAEFNPSNAFEAGKVAMVIDGEWRVGFVKNDKSSVPYATAPFPVADQAPELYGVGQIGGTTIGIPRGTQHPAEAWLLVKWLSLNTHVMESLAEQLHNIPTVLGALTDPKLTGDPHFDTFLKIFANPDSRYKQITPLGLTDVTLFGNLADKYVAGKISDLQTALEDLAAQIDKQQQLGG